MQSKIELFDGIPPLLFRLILAPVFIVAGYSKLGMSSDEASGIDLLLADPNVVNWFGNAQWGLGLPFPDLLAFLAGWTEFLGGWFLLVGIFTRLISIPLIVTMLVAMITVHADNGWFAVTPTNPDTSAALPLNWLSIPGAEQSLTNSKEAAERLSRIKELIETHGYPEYLLEKGNIVILNNGIEFGFIYFALLMSLLMTGGGRYTSIDHFIKRTIK